MTKVPEARTEQETLKVIQSAEPAPIATVVDQVQRTFPTVSEAEIKSAVWRLQSVGQVEVTPDWKFITKRTA